MDKEEMLMTVAAGMTTGRVGEAMIVIDVTIKMVIPMIGIVLPSQTLGEVTMIYCCWAPASEATA